MRVGDKSQKPRLGATHPQTPRSDREEGGFPPLPTPSLPLLNDQGSPGPRIQKMIERRIDLAECQRQIGCDQNKKKEVLVLKKILIPLFFLTQWTCLADENQVFHHPKIIHWVWFGGIPKTEEIKNIEHIVLGNPHYEFYFWYSKHNLNYLSANPQLGIRDLSFGKKGLNTEQTVDLLKQIFLKVKENVHEKWQDMGKIVSEESGTICLKNIEGEFSRFYHSSKNSKLDLRVFLNFIYMECANSIGGLNYASASDIARWVILLLYGGTYLDLDCHVISSLENYHNLVKNLNPKDDILGEITSRLGVKFTTFLLHKETKTPEFSKKEILNYGKNYDKQNEIFRLFKSNNMITMTENHFMAVFILDRITDHYFQFLKGEDIVCCGQNISWFDKVFDFGKSRSRHLGTLHAAGPVVMQEEFVRTVNCLITVNDHFADLKGEYLDRITASDASFVEASEIYSPRMDMDWVEDKK